MTPPLAPETRDVVDRYYKSAETWANDRTEALKASRRVAWIIAIITVLIALALSIALMLMMPLKTVVPYTLMVDRQTGHVQALKPIDADKIAADTALTQSFVVQYVIARESFDFATVQKDYRKVMLWSEGAARRGYDSGIQVSNSGSAINRLPRGSAIETNIRSVSALGRNSSLVRFETYYRNKSGVALATRPWVAIIVYRYSDTPMSLEERLINPLGFQVTRYTRNPEAIQTIAPRNIYDVSDQTELVRR
jgi:type IV secretion system protein VirB8